MMVPAFNSAWLLKNTIQEYAWGSRTAIPELMDAPSPASLPQAELWMGAHPKAPSQVLSDGHWFSLDELISTYPGEILGEPLAQQFDGQLPFLFKVLAAAEPLSIQAHPDMHQAKNGFDRENQMGIDLKAPHRNYKDPFHKPECLCALTPFWGLCGFRPPDEVYSLLERADLVMLLPECDRLLKTDHSERVRDFFETLMHQDEVQRHAIIHHAMSMAESLSGSDPVFHWMMRLESRYPGDIGVLSPLLLNLIYLKPGEALFLPAGELHAYLEGTGIELMANSDNVLRGGLTPKHVDLPELLRVLNFKPRRPDVLRPVTAQPLERIYPTSAKEFVLSVIEPKPPAVYHSPEKRLVEILLCTHGDVTIETMHANAIRIRKGQSVLIPALAGPYRIEGEGTLYKAAVPIDNLGSL